MGALNPFWKDKAVDDYSKYLIFCAIPCNLLLWGCESWALREATLQKLEVFLHRSVRKILRITITQVIDDSITNDSLRVRFFNIPSIRNQIAKRQLTFIGKVVRNTDDQIPTQLLTAWCEHPRKRGAPLQNNKKNLAQNIRLIVPGAAKDGLLSSWVYSALDDAYWAHLVSQLGTRPSTWSGAKPNPRSTPPPARHVGPPARQHPHGAVDPPPRIRLPMPLRHHRVEQRPNPPRGAPRLNLPLLDSRITKVGIMETTIQNK